MQAADDNDILLITEKGLEDYLDQLQEEGK